MDGLRSSARCLAHEAPLQVAEGLLRPPMVHPDEGGGRHGGGVPGGGEAAAGGQQGAQCCRGHGIAGEDGATVGLLGGGEVQLGGGDGGIHGRGLLGDTGCPGGGRSMIDWLDGLGLA